MKKNVVSIQDTASLKDAAKLMVEKKVGTLPVLNDQSKLVGEISITDIVYLLLPDFVSLLENIDFVKDFGALKTPSGENLARIYDTSLTEIMDSPVSVEEDCDLVRALSVMKNHKIRDLLVVSNDRLVGIASWVDVGRALLASTLDKAGK
jgi:CBS domain-containing protein